MDLMEKRGIKSMDQFSEKFFHTVMKSISKHLSEQSSIEEAVQ